VEVSKFIKFIKIRIIDPCPDRDRSVLPGWARNG